MDTLTERTKRRLPRPTSKQMIAAAEIIARANGESTAGARSSALQPFADGPTLFERFDRVGLDEERILRKLSGKLDAKETQFFAKDGLVTDERTVVSHGTQLKAIRYALELRGLLQRGNRVSVGVGGNAQIAVGLPWSPVPVPDDNSTVPSNSSIPNDQSSAPSTVISTIEGTGSGRGAAGHSRSTTKSHRTVPVEHMSLLQLKNVPAEVRAAELERRLLLREKKNKRHRKHVGPNHTSRAGKGVAGTCRSGKCGKCRECKRRAKLRIST